MRIVLLGQWHSEKMGYSDNFLPKALAALGHDVHLVTSVGQVYFNSPVYAQTFERFLGPPTVAPGTKEVNGYTLHRLPVAQWRDKVHLRGMFDALRRLDPDIVQAGELDCVQTYEAAVANPFMRYRFFAECHAHASVFPAATGTSGLRDSTYWAIHRRTLGPLVGMAVERVYAISSDAADIAVNFFGIPRQKVVVRSLGVDTDLFADRSDPVARDLGARTRASLGLLPHEIICVYTGRLDTGKNPLCLARAVERLVDAGRPFRALFVGDGKASYVDEIRSCRGSVVHEFVPVTELPQFYHAADIAVWPRQESTSQLDAVACGLPIVLSDRIQVLERVEGNGFLYHEDDVNSLASVLESLESRETRERMGTIGAEKVRARYSWRLLAEEYAADYQAALRS